MIDQVVVFGGRPRDKREYFALVAELLRPGSAAEAAEAADFLAVYTAVIYLACQAAQHWRAQECRLRRLQRAERETYLRMRRLALGASEAIRQDFAGIEPPRPLRRGRPSDTDLRDTIARRIVRNFPGKTSTADRWRLAEVMTRAIVDRAIDPDELRRDCGRRIRKGGRHSGALRMFASWAAQLSGAARDG